jgi:hypothetical protein
MSEKLYQVKAFVIKDGKQEEIIEDFSTYNEAYDRYIVLAEADETCDAAYLYMDGTMSLAWSSSYDDYLEEAAERRACVFCGSQGLDGYCWQSPDGTHHGGED